MVVCLCHRLTDRDLEELYAEAESAEQVFELLGDAPVCGQCVEYIGCELRRRLERRRGAADEPETRRVSSENVPTS